MFNQDARWDRPLPQDDAPPGEPIDVVASFKRGGFFPLWFFLHGNKHVIKNIEFSWQKKKGREIFRIFSVTDSYDTRYTLCFIRQRLVWKIIQEE